VYSKVILGQFSWLIKYIFCVRLTYMNETKLILDFGLEEEESRMMKILRLNVRSSLSAIEQLPADVGHGRNTG
jgi:hypothetical protein